MEVIRQGLSLIEPEAPVLYSPTETVEMGTEPPGAEPPPIVPAGHGPETPREGNAGDVFRAIADVPAIKSSLQELQTTALEQARRLNRGERAAVITTAVLVGGGALAGVLSRPEIQQIAVGKLNGRAFPILGVRGLNVELNLSGNDYMVGFHLDVGALLPVSLNFGPSSPTAIGGPPTPPER